MVFPGRQISGSGMAPSATGHPPSRRTPASAGNVADDLSMVKPFWRVFARSSSSHYILAVLHMKHDSLSAWEHGSGAAGRRSVARFNTGCALGPPDWVKRNRRVCAGMWDRSGDLLGPLGTLLGVLGGQVACFANELRVFSRSAGTLACVRRGRIQSF
jgi:hypothetical protein